MAVKAVTQALFEPLDLHLLLLDTALPFCNIEREFLVIRRSWRQLRVAFVVRSLVLVVTEVIKRLFHEVIELIREVGHSLLVIFELIKSFDLVVDGGVFFHFGLFGLDLERSGLL